MGAHSIHMPKSDLLAVSPNRIAFSLRRPRFQSSPFLRMIENLLMRFSDAVNAGVQVIRYGSRSLLWRET